MEHSAQPRRCGLIPTMQRTILASNQRKNDEHELGGGSSSRCFDVDENRSDDPLIHSELDVSCWAENDPDVEAARPARC